MSTPYGPAISASIDQELAELRDDAPATPDQIHALALLISEQFPAIDDRELARIILCAGRSVGGLRDSGLPAMLMPAALSLLAGELDRRGREGQS